VVGHLSMLQSLVLLCSFQFQIKGASWVVEEAPKEVEQVVAVLDFLGVVVVGMAHLASLLVELALGDMALVVEAVVDIYQDCNGNCKSMEHQEGMTPQL